MQNVSGLITAGSRETLKLIENYTNNDKIILMNFTETWLDKKIREEADLEGFNTYRCDRTSEIARGGVAIYLYDKLETGQKWEKRNNKCEMVGIEIKEIQTTNFVIYRPPDTKKRRVQGYIRRSKKYFKQNRN